MDERERFESGMKIRREVLGDAHVDSAIAKRNAFTEEFQNLITRYAWGEIWTRPALPRQTRSLITVAMLVALNREEELRLHLRAALRNEMERPRKKSARRCCNQPFTVACLPRIPLFASPRKSLAKNLK